MKIWLRLISFHSFKTQAFTFAVRLSRCQAKSRDKARFVSNIEWILLTKSIIRNSNEIPSNYKISKWYLLTVKMACSLTREIFLNTVRQISYLRAVMQYPLFHTQGFCLVRNFKLLLAEAGNLWFDFIKVIRIVAQQWRSSRSISPTKEEFIRGELHESI